MVAGFTELALTDIPSTSSSLSWHQPVCTGGSLSRVARAAKTLARKVLHGSSPGEPSRGLPWTLPGRASWCAWSISLSGSPGLAGPRSCWVWLARTGTGNTAQSAWRHWSRVNTKCRDVKEDLSLSVLTKLLEKKMENRRCEVRKYSCGCVNVFRTICENFRQIGQPLSELSPIYWVFLEV